MMNQNEVCVLFIDFQERLMPAIFGGGAGLDGLMNKVCALAQGARLLELPVLVTRQYPKGLGDTVGSLAEALGDHDYVDKTAFSCVGEGAFVQRLEAVGKKTVIVAGVESHICVLQTVLDLLERGYVVYLAEDCCGSRDDKSHAMALGRMVTAGAVLTNTESALFEILRDAGHPARKGISALIKDF